jgi:hypothetical protein
MAKLTANGAKLSCSEGLSPSSLTVLQAGATPETGGMVVASVADRVPFVNIAPFGMCKTQANPQVAAATAAAMGVLTPMPCLPIVLAPWAPGSPIVQVSGSDALTSDSRCDCLWTGQITITDPASTVDL